MHHRADYLSETLPMDRFWVDMQVHATAQSANTANRPGRDCRSTSVCTDHEMRPERGARTHKLFLSGDVEHALRLVNSSLGSKSGGEVISSDSY